MSEAQCLSLKEQEAVPKAQAQGRKAASTALGIGPSNRCTHLLQLGCLRTQLHRLAHISGPAVQPHDDAYRSCATIAELGCTEASGLEYAIDKWLHPHLADGAFQLLFADFTGLQLRCDSLQVML